MFGWARRLRKQPDPEEKQVGHFARKGASASTRERERSLKRQKQSRISDSKRILFMCEATEA